MTAETQSAVGAFVALLSIFLYRELEPYSDRLTNLLANVAMWMGFITFLSAFIIETRPARSSTRFARRVGYRMGGAGDADARGRGRSSLLRGRSRGLRWGAVSETTRGRGTRGEGVARAYRDRARGRGTRSGIEGRTRRRRGRGGVRARVGECGGKSAETKRLAILRSSPGICASPT